MGLPYIALKAYATLMYESLLRMQILTFRTIPADVAAYRKKQTTKGVAKAQPLDPTAATMETLTIDEAAVERLAGLAHRTHEPCNINTGICPYTFI